MYARFLGYVGVNVDVVCKGNDGEQARRLNMVSTTECRPYVSGCSTASKQAVLVLAAETDSLIRDKAAQ